MEENNTATSSHGEARAQRVAYICAVAAFGVWAVFPIYFKWVVHISGYEVLAHRVIWGTLICISIVVAKGQWSLFLTALKTKRVLVSCLICGCLISMNWLIFIFAIVENHILECSFGYFISPLLSVCLGRIFFGEHISRWQIFAVCLASLGVFYQIFSFDHVPWYGLGLAGSFAVYGVVKKRAQVDALIGLSIEILLMTPVAFAYLYWLIAYGDIHFLRQGGVDSALLIGLGILTPLPLLLFAVGAKRIPLSTIGILQYMTPVGHFLIGVLIYGEVVGQHEVVSFALVVAAVVVFVSASFFQKSKR